MKTIGFHLFFLVCLVCCLENNAKKLCFHSFFSGFSCFCGRLWAAAIVCPKSSAKTRKTRKTHENTAFSIVFKTADQKNQKNQWKQLVFIKICKSKIVVFSFVLLIFAEAVSGPKSSTSSWSISPWNPQGIPFNVNGNLFGEKAFAKSMEIGLESSWSISQWNA